MNILDNYNILQPAFDSVEYQGWFHSVLDEISRRRLKIKEIQERYPEGKDSFGDPLEDFSIESLQGNGGFNKYIIDGNGRIRFSVLHAIDDLAEQKAKDAGFDTY